MSAYSASRCRPARRPSSGRSYPMARRLDGDADAFLPAPGTSQTCTRRDVAPGGGFRWLSMGNEGWEVAQALNASGIAAFVLKYPLQPTPDSLEGLKQSMERMQVVRDETRSILFSSPTRRTSSGSATGSPSSTAAASSRQRHRRLPRSLAKGAPRRPSSGDGTAHRGPGRHGEACGRYGSRSASVRPAARVGRVRSGRRHHAGICRTS